MHDRQTERRRRERGSRGRAGSVGAQQSNIAAKALIMSPDSAVPLPSLQATAERCPLHRDSAEILRFAAETCLLMSTTNRFISPSHGETVNGNTLSASLPFFPWHVNWILAEEGRRRRRRRQARHHCTPRWATARASKPLLSPLDGVCTKRPLEDSLDIQSPTSRREGGREEGRRVLEASRHPSIPTPQCLTDYSYSPLRSRDERGKRLASEQAERGGEDKRRLEGRGGEKRRHA